MGGGRDGFGSTEAGAHATEVLSQERFAPVEALSSHSESQRRAVFCWTSPGRQHLSAADTLVRAKAQPRGKGSDIGEGREVGTDFSQQPLCRQRGDTRHLGEIDPKSTVEILQHADRFVSPRALAWAASLWNGILCRFDSSWQLLST